jgi:hypothetical protein
MTARDVELAADALLRAGNRPSVQKIREALGGGSPNTINPMLDTWWKRLSSRLDAGPAALHRLPESVAHVAEALWMQALDEGRRRVALEQHSTERALANDRERLQVRSHVLSLREGELESRLHDRERTQAALESRLQELSLLLRKEQATREAQAKRISALENELLARPRTPLTTTRSGGERPLGLPRAQRGVRHEVPNKPARKLKPPPKMQNTRQLKRAERLRRLPARTARKNAMTRKPTIRKRRR